MRESTQFIMTVVSMPFVLAMTLAHAEPVMLVENGEGLAVIVVPDEASSVVQNAAQELQYYIERASGAALPIVPAPALGAADADRPKILVGFGPGIQLDALLPEEYVIRTAGNVLCIVGEQPSRDAVATLYGVYDFLDRVLGVRWLWPGEIGAFVPRRATIAVEPLDIRARPALEKRELRIHLRRGHEEQGVAPLLDADALKRVEAEARQWLQRHRMGGRSRLRFGHAFGDWWDRYHEAHPEYFAVPPAGVKLPYPNPGRVKLCVSNPAVAGQILDEWRAAGRPDNWNVCPNDSRGFCTCANCRALDGFPGQAPETVWNGEDAVLTGRYIALWNTLLPRMRAENPKATLSSYAYSNYREPLEGMRVEEGLVLGMVHTYHAYDPWRKWHEAGAKLFLRPNWWHIGALAPVNPLHAMGDYFTFAHEHSMLGFDFDSLMGYWGTQGPCYYLIARLSVRPELTVDEVINEYCAAFGNAAPHIKRYLAYWEDHTTKCGYAIPAGGAVQPDAESLYLKTCAEHGFDTSPLRSGWLVLPYLYTDAVLTPAFRILDEAARAAQGDDAMVQARVRFLRDGLVHLEQTRDVIALVYDKDRPAAISEADIAARLAALQALRAELTPRHVVWGEVANWVELHRGVRSAFGRPEWAGFQGH